MRTPKKKMDRYLDREDFGLSRFAWTKAEEYDIDSDYKVVVTKVGNIKLSAPLEDPDLFFSFARLASRGRPSDNSVLRWVKKYGLPKVKHKDSSAPIWKGEPNQASMSIDELRGEALEAHSALNLYHDLYSRDINSFRKRIGELREDRKRWKQLSKIDEWLVEEWGHEADRQTWDSNLPWMAEGKLREFVTRRVENIRLDLAGGGFWDPTDDGYRPKQSWKCPDLLSAMYLQFYLLITNSLPVRRCNDPSCRMPFPVTRKNRRVCNSTCRSNKRHYPDSN